MPNQIEIDEAIVQRRHQRIGAGGNVPGQRIIAAGRVIDDEIVRFRKPLAQGIKFFDALAVVYFERGGWQLDRPAAHGFSTIFEIAVHRALAGIKIDRRHARTLIGQCHSDVDGSGGLAGSAFFVGEDDTMGAVRQGAILSVVMRGSGLREDACPPIAVPLGLSGEVARVQTIKRLVDLREAVDALKNGGKHVALVPTMGALHEGHLTLVREAAKHADHVIVSIFVNPRQFGPNEDLDAYPRRLAADAALLQAEGVAVLWAPTVDQMYPDGYATNVSVSGVSEVACGAARPGHFDGVATVVCKLFNQVRPDFALFGEKDWQQLAVIRRMARDLDLTLPCADAIIGVPTVREASGLAMSSRNQYLTQDQRDQAAGLSAAMRLAITDVEGGADVVTSLTKLKAAILAAGFASIDYADLRDAATLEELATFAGQPARLLVAARIGRTRLIDNMGLGRD